MYRDTAVVWAAKWTPTSVTPVAVHVFAFRHNLLIVAELFSVLEYRAT